MAAGKPLDPDIMQRCSIPQFADVR